MPNPNPNPNGSPTGSQYNVKLSHATSSMDALNVPAVCELFGSIIVTDDGRLLRWMGFANNARFRPGWSSRELDWSGEDVRVEFRPADPYEGIHVCAG